MEQPWPEEIGSRLFIIKRMERKISALKVQQRNPHRVNVYLDGEFAFGITRVAAAWLRIGQELSDEKISRLIAEDAGEKAYQQALRLLAYRSRSAAEVSKNLEGHGVAENTIQEVLERLQRAGLIDDDRFARDWVENRSEFRPRSRRALAIEMRQRGLDDEVITKAISGLDDDRLVYQAALKHSRKLRGLDWQGFRQKMTGFLARRGFYYEAIAPAVKRVWDENHMDKVEEDLI